MKILLNLFKNKMLRLYFLIDLTFYSFLFFGFLAMFFYKDLFDWSLQTTVIIWLFIIIPLIVIKITKDIKNKRKG